MGVNITAGSGQPGSNQTTGGTGNDTLTGSGAPIGAPINNIFSGGVSNDNHSFTASSPSVPIS